MRIIAGKYRSRKLVTLPGLQTRPTLDRTKEAFFSSIGSDLTGLLVLDLFGGSGALSLESLSRGACRAVIAENNPAAVQVIQKNQAALGVSRQELTVLPISYKEALAKLKKTSFDLIFLDPPFRLKVIDEIIATILKDGLLNEGGYIIAEYPREDIVRKDYAELDVKLCRRYASSEVLILRRSKK